ncbi:unnamed protein product [Prorocentrum cordatum]|uniref:DUF1279 domain-containing protein n=1 Tax=Prorocentrum cordatum TaxID=2364126 RepID=A0ABN9QMB4_9DINO|nr:unnamed protein product [Polarella glacialis]
MQAARPTLQETLTRYGKVGLGVHICLSTVSFAGCYTAVRFQLPVDLLLERFGLSSRTSGTEPAAGVGVTEGKEDSVAVSGAASAGSTAVVAYVVYKALLPVRASITVALTPLVARTLTRLRYPAMVARVLAEWDAPPPGVPAAPATGPPPPAGPEAGCQWRSLFRRRFLRQQAWDAEKQRKSRAPAAGAVTERARAAEEPPLKKDGKFHPSGRAKVTRGIENGRERTHAPRMRACRRCGLDFDPQSRDLTGCGWHAGRFAPFDPDGVAVGRATSKDFERRARDIIKAHNRKKTSRRANVVVFGAACDNGVEREAINAIVGSLLMRFRRPSC